MSWTRLVARTVGTKVRIHYLDHKIMGYSQYDFLHIYLHTLSSLRPPVDPAAVSKGPPDVQNTKFLWVISDWIYLC